MSIVNTDWASFLSPDSNLPPDVIFQVEGQSDGAEENIERRNIGAHKLFLAGVSPVFWGMFFGPLKERGDIVNVKDTPPEAFDTMVKYIYNPRDGVMFNLKEIEGCPQKLFELLAVADKYQILCLAEMTRGALEKLALTKENMIFTATVALAYKSAFGELSTELLLKCLKFLMDTATGGGGGILALIQDTVDNFPGASFDILHELLKVGNEKLHITGQESLVFFDPKEREIEYGVVAEIPKLGSQWKVILDFQPTQCIQNNESSHHLLSFSVQKPQRYRPVSLALHSSSFYMGYWEFQNNTLGNWKTIRRNRGSNQMLKVGEWTRIEFSHELVEGRDFLALFIGGQEVSRGEILGPELRGFCDLQVILGLSGSLPGYIRRLAVLERK